MNEKQISKIRKLLALSQSDNPHEAEIAKRQAESLMRKFAIGRDDLEISSVDCKPIKRRAIKLYENTLCLAVEQISGCFGLFRSEPFMYGSRVNWKTTLRFTGLCGQSELAAYCFDVLRDQAEKAAYGFRVEQGANWREADLFAEGWVESACEKLINVFGECKIPTTVQNRKNIEHEKAESVSPLTVNEIYVKDVDGCYESGFVKGEDAVLNQATTDQREVQLRLERD